MSTLSFFVPGIPKSTQTGSVVRVKGRAFPIRRNTAWSQVVGLVARQYAPSTLLEGPLYLGLRFTFSRPKSSKREKPSVRPDLDNLLKGLADSLNGVLWRDDAQIVAMFVNKNYGAVPGLHVLVKGLLPDEAAPREGTT